MADARRTLELLGQEWKGCTKCNLGAQREANDGKIVFGEGGVRGIMFIGEGPGEVEENSGRPFVGPSGEILRGILNRLGVENHYISNIISCRSCEPFADAAGNPIIRKSFRGPPRFIWKDMPPSPAAIEACKPRLYEEIYLVDPVVIVALGATAAKTLLRKHVAITDPSIRGQPVHIQVPGAGMRAVVTDKKGVWARKIQGKLALPIERNEVSYLCIPTLHPAFVARRIADRGADSPFSQLAGDIKKAVQVYERFMTEAYGTVPSGNIELNLGEVQQTDETYNDPDIE